jgi:hypothetical protein
MISDFNEALESPEMADAIRRSQRSGENSNAAQENDAEEDDTTDKGRTGKIRRNGTEVPLYNKAGIAPEVPSGNSEEAKTPKVRQVLIEIMGFYRRQRPQHAACVKSRWPSELQQ